MQDGFDGKENAHRLHGHFIQLLHIQRSGGKELYQQIGLLLLVYFARDILTYALEICNRENGP